MRILLSAFACAPDEGSEESVGWHWALEIARLGHDVLVLTVTRDRAVIEAERASGRLPPNLRFAYYMPAWLDRLMRHGLPLQLVHVLWQYGAYRHARRLLERERFDLVHHITYCGIRQPSFMGRLPVPFVLGPVGGGERGPMTLRRGMGARGWALDLVRDGLNLLLKVDPVTQQALAAARLIYVSSPDTARLVPRRQRDKVRVRMQIGIRPADSPLPEPDERRSPDAPLRLLFVGRCLAWKGLHLGLEALAALRARGRAARLTVAGRGSAEPTWRKLAADLDLEDAVDWLSWVDYTRMPEVYRAHDVLLFPSLHDSGGLAVLEALAQGLPVVCLDLGGPGTVVDATCGRVITTHGRSRTRVVDELASALEELAESPALRRRLAHAAPVRAHQYDWSRLVGSVYAEIDAALRQPPRERDVVALGGP